MSSSSALRGLLPRWTLVFWVALICQLVETRQLLSAGQCNRGMVSYSTNSSSPFVSSSLYFEPLLAGSYTTVELAFALTHELCRGDKILVELPGFVLDPDSDDDPQLISTGPDEFYSKYTAEWRGDVDRLIFTYTDFYPISGIYLRDLYISEGRSTAILDFCRSFMACGRC